MRVSTWPLVIAPVANASATAGAAAKVSAALTSAAASRRHACGTHQLGYALSSPLLTGILGDCFCTGGGNRTLDIGKSRQPHLTHPRQHRGPIKPAGDARHPRPECLRAGNLPAPSTVRIHARTVRKGCETGWTSLISNYTHQHIPIMTNRCDTHEVRCPRLGPDLTSVVKPA